MSTLFPDDSRLPEGFSYFPDFITGDEETQLLAIISHIPLHTFLFRGFEAKRKVASFGYDYHFDTRSISRNTDIPESFQFLLNKVASKLSMDAGAFEELLVTEYPEQAVINWHRDAPPFDLIAGISLLTDCTFRLRPYDKAKQTRSNMMSLSVKRRSLYVMQGAARSEWEHSITPVRQIRYSITLRTLRK